MLKKLFKSIDFGSLLVVFVLFLFGIVALYSANGGINGDISEVWKQVLWFSVGTIFVTLLVMMDYTIFEKLWVPLYGLIMILLVLVLFTEPINRRD